MLSGFSSAAGGLIFKAGRNERSGGSDDSGIHQPAAADAVAGIAGICQATETVPRPAESTARTSTNDTPPRYGRTRTVVAVLEAHGAPPTCYVMSNTSRA